MQVGRSKPGLPRRPNAVHCPLTHQLEVTQLLAAQLLSPSRIWPLLYACMCCCRPPPPSKHANRDPSWTADPLPKSMSQPGLDCALSRALEEILPILPASLEPALRVPDSRGTA
jgi:hypothetical protein